MAGGLQTDDNDDLDEQHEIDVTPFIDVMLVLLIIFMVAAPLSTVNIPVDLPVSQAQPQKRPDKPVFVTVKADLSLAVGEEAVVRSTLGAALERATAGQRDARLYLRADKTVPYGALMQVMDQLRTAGFLKVGLVGLEGPPRAAAAP